MRDKESPECGRMHIWALETQKLPGPLTGSWTPAANGSLCSCNFTLLHCQFSVSEAGVPLDQILDLHLNPFRHQVWDPQPCWWQLVVITGDLFKLVYLWTNSKIRWWLSHDKVQGVVYVHAWVYWQREYISWHTGQWSVLVNWVKWENSQDGV